MGILGELYRFLPSYRFPLDHDLIITFVNPINEMHSRSILFSIVLAVGALAATNEPCYSGGRAGESPIPLRHTFTESRRSKVFVLAPHLAKPEVASLPTVAAPLMLPASNAARNPNAITVPLETVVGSPTALEPRSPAHAPVQANSSAALPRPLDSVDTKHPSSPPLERARQSPSTEPRRSLNSSQAVFERSDASGSAQEPRITATERLTT